MWEGLGLSKWKKCLLRKVAKILSKLHDVNYNFPFWKGRANSGVRCRKMQLNVISRVVPYYSRNFYFHRVAHSAPRLVSREALLFCYKTQTKWRERGGAEPRLKIRI